MTLRPGMLVKLDLPAYVKSNSYYSYQSKEHNTTERKISKDEIGLLVDLHVTDARAFAVVLFGDKLELVSRHAIQGLNGEV